MWQQLQCLVYLAFLLVELAPLVQVQGQVQVQGLDRFADPNLQTFALYDGPNPYSKNVSFEVYDGNWKNLTDVSEIVRKNKTQSWCSTKQGMWFFYSEPNFSPQSEYFGFVKTPRSEETQESIRCAQLETKNGQTTQIQSIRRMTHANLSVPAISLFKSVHGVFSQELFMDGQALSLPEPLEFSAYGFTGYGNWTVFSSTNFKGTSTCLTLPLDYTLEMNPRQRPRVALLSVGINLALLVGSMRRNCSGFENLIQHPLNSTVTVLNIRNSEKSGPESRQPLSYVNPNKSAKPPLVEEEHKILIPSIELEIENSSQSLLFSGTELVLPQPIPVTHYQFRNPGESIGNIPTADTMLRVEWGLFSGLDFTGKEYCAKSNSTEFKPPILVMSLKRGCSSAVALLVNATCSEFYVLIVLCSLALLLHIKLCI